VKTIWHDLEVGGYTADLSLWEDLSEEEAGPILDLGCGSGRVAIHLARHGRRVQGLDADPDLVAVFNERALASELPAAAVVGDAREFSLGERYGLVIAPMQLIQLLSSREERLACLRCVGDHLARGGTFAAAIVEGAPASPPEAEPPLPDARELDGWVYSSLPLETRVNGETIVVRRLRQTVSPAGELREETDEANLRVLAAETLEAEAGEVALRPTGRHQVPATDAHIGSTVVLLEAP
jgi:SAM-dependent methyltransferase